MKTREGEDRIIVWENAKVAMPILSTHELARNGKQVLYDEDHGVIIDKKTGKTSKVIAAAGVYFIQLFVSKDLGVQLEPPFGRPG